LQLGVFALNHHLARRERGVLHAMDDLLSGGQPNSSVAKKARLIKCEDMKLRVVVEYDSKAGRFSAVFPELPGCASAGDTEAEALANAKEALALWFEPDNTPLPKNAKLVELTV
jgi:predicted RNase H-like HicB family nuclease